MYSDINHPSFFSTPSPPSLLASPLINCLGQIRQIALPGFFAPPTNYPHALHESQPKHSIRIRIHLLMNTKKNHPHLNIVVSHYYLCSIVYVHYVVHVYMPFVNLRVCIRLCLGAQFSCISCVSVWFDSRLGVVCSLSVVCIHMFEFHVVYLFIRLPSSRVCVCV